MQNRKLKYYEELPIESFSPYVVSSCVSFSLWLGFLFSRIALQMALQMANVLADAADSNANEKRHNSERIVVEHWAFMQQMLQQKIH